MLLLDFIDKTNNSYIIKCVASDYSFKFDIQMPFIALEQFNDIGINREINYSIRIKSSEGYYNEPITLKKILNKKGRMLMKFTTNEGTLLVPSYKFSNIKTESYLFSTYIDITGYASSMGIERSDIITYTSYRLLNVYDTRSKAKYFLEKYYKRFVNIYKKYLVKEYEEYDLVNEIITVDHERILFEKKFEFITQDGNRACYAFMIICQRKG